MSSVCLQKSEFVWFRSNRIALSCSGCQTDEISSSAPPLADSCPRDDQTATLWHSHFCMAAPPHTHKPTLSLLCIHRFYPHIVASSHSHTPVSLFTSFLCSLAHSYTHAHTFFPHAHQFTQRLTLSHTPVTQDSPLPSPPLLPPACHFAFGQREPEWSEGVSAMHMKCSLHPDMHVSADDCWEESPLRACRVHLRSGWVRPRFCPRDHTRFRFGLIHLKPFFFSSLEKKFDQLLHSTLTGGYTLYAYFRPKGASCSLLSCLLSWKGER